MFSIRNQKLALAALAGAALALPLGAMAQYGTPGGAGKNPDYSSSGHPGQGNNALGQGKQQGVPFTVGGKICDPKTGDPCGNAYGLSK